MNQDALMTVKEVARYLHVVQLTIYRMIDRGDLPAVKVGSRWRIRRQDLDNQRLISRLSVGLGY